MATFSHVRPDVPALHAGALSRRRLLAGLLAAACAPAVQASRLNLPLAEEAPPGMDPGGYLVSEKLDGVRALWDGQRLRFRSGLPVAAPGWFTARLPPEPLDGELWLGRGRFDALSGTVRRVQPDEAAWREVQYQVFDLPDHAAPFAQRAARLQALVARHGVPALQALAQQALPDAAALARRLDEVLRLGGEGLVLRRADAPYVGGRSAAMLKLKPLHDAEAVVLAHLPGRGRHAGRLGALQVRNEQGVVFRLGTGFSDAQRLAPPALGQRISYTHRGHTDAGVPRFASFLRERPEGL